MTNDTKTVEELIADLEELPEDTPIYYSNGGALASADTVDYQTDRSDRNHAIAVIRRDL